MRKFLLFSLLTATLLSLSPAWAATVYRPGQGFQSEKEDAGPLEKSAAGQLRKAQELEAAGRTSQAIGAYRGILTGFPNSGAAPRAQFKVAELREKQGDLEQAYKEYSKYLSKYPRGKDFDAVVERQFGIAKAFLGGERQKLLGIKTFSSMDKARKMFEEIVKNAPYSKFAPLAQFNIGMAHEKRGEFAEALAAYQLTVDKYPYDTVAADAQYQIGYVHMNLIRKKTSNDENTRIKAHDAFEDFAVRYPQSEKLPQAREHLNTLSRTNLKKTLDTAKFYDKTGNYKAALIYYQDVIDTGKDAPEAAEARKAIERLKKITGAS